MYRSLSITIMGTLSPTTNYTHLQCPSILQHKYISTLWLHNNGNIHTFAHYHPSPNGKKHFVIITTGNSWNHATFLKKIQCYPMLECIILNVQTIATKLPYIILIQQTQCIRLDVQNIAAWVRHSFYCCLYHIITYQSAFLLLMHFWPQVSVILIFI